jgi:hypothetical protein
MPSMHSKRRKKHELITTRKHELSIIRGNTVTTLLVITMSPPCLPYNHTFTQPHHPTTTPPHHHTTTHNPTLLTAQSTHQHQFLRRVRMTVFGTVLHSSFHHTGPCVRDPIGKIIHDRATHLVLSLLAFFFLF